MAAASRSASIRGNSIPLLEADVLLERFADRSAARRLMPSPDPSRSPAARSSRWSDSTRSAIAASALPPASQAGNRIDSSTRK